MNMNPYLFYCIIIWGGATQLALYRLNVLQKRAVRLIAHSTYCSHTSLLFKRFGILKLCDVYKLQIYLFMFKYKYGMLPVSCQKFINGKSITSHYDFRKEYEFLVAKFHSEIRRKGIAVIGPDMWNSLQDSMRHLSSISVFKSRMVSACIEKY